ncbi:radical SAM protein [candidate division KSB1 bacterium]|nr:radical SAM protein [candidate division KSB1 bacterium]
MKQRSFKHLFGPVSSRRLGISLGVNLVTHKTCPFDCVYCECGATTHFTTNRSEYVPAEEVIKELADYLSNKPILDYITFSGSGEPTLHSKLGTIVSYLKSNYPNYNIALITNGALLSQPELLAEVKHIDLIIPSLDAVSEDIFRKIDRPIRSLKSADVIHSLIQLRQHFKGQIWLEIFIIPGLNDHDDEIDKFNDVLEQIKPDRIQLNSLDRPGTEAWVKEAEPELLKRIAEKLNRDTEIISRFKSKSYIENNRASIQESIINILKRHPYTVEDLASMTGLHTDEIRPYIETLLNDGCLEFERLDHGVLLRVASEQKLAGSL